MKLIQYSEITDASGQASIVLNNIPGTFTDLLLVVSTRTNGGGPDCLFYLNGDRSNLSGQRIRGNGSDVLASLESPYLENQVSGDTAGIFSSGSAYITDYAKATYKSISTDAIRENNATDSRQALMGGVWASNDPITSITIQPSAAVNFIQYSSATLYGIAAGSDGITAVS